MEPREKVFEILKKFSTAMFVTANLSNRLESRPMQVAKAEENGQVWFFTSKTGRVSTEVKENPEVLLVMQDERSYYLSLRGNARRIDDKSKIKEFFSEPYKVWFPGGPEDPNLQLIAFDPVSAEYWDNGGTNKLQYMFESVKAYVTGDTPNVEDKDQHAKTRL